MKYHDDWTSKIKQSLEKSRQVKLMEVDAHNVVPVWLASEKAEQRAMRFGCKLYDQLKAYLSEFPPVISHPTKAPYTTNATSFEALYESLDIDTV